jgi:hypothetical protein
MRTITLPANSPKTLKYSRMVLMGKAKGPFFSQDMHGHSQANYILPGGSKPKAPRRIKGKTRTNPPSGPIVWAVDDDFFISALRQYERWQMAWWREALQNSVDNGATVIRITVAALDDGSTSITFADNGTGMSEATLLNKFLSLGGSGKRDNEGATVGGFGEAKRLLLLPWARYMVVTKEQGQPVVGIIGHKMTAEHMSPEQAQPYLIGDHGTTLSVVMGEQATTADYAKEVLRLCYLPSVKVYLNDERISTTDLVIDSELDGILDSDYAKLFYSPRAKRGAGFLHCRINGMWMFSEPLDESVKGAVIVEIAQRYSRDLIQSNRDGFRTEWGSKGAALSNGLDRWKRNLAANKMSALKPKSKKKVVLYGDPDAENAALNPRLMEDIAEELERARNRILRKYEGRMPDQESLQEMSEEIQETAAEATKLPVAGVDKVMTDIAKSGPGGGSLANIPASMSNLPLIAVINDYEDWAPGRGFVPGSMSPSLDKLLTFWNEVCRIVLFQLEYTSAFNIGLIYSDTALAECRTENGFRFLSINPIDGSKKVRYSLRDKKDIDTIFALAVHECSHLIDDRRYGDHDEVFTSIMTMNMAKCMPVYAYLTKIRDAVVKAHVEKRQERQEKKDRTFDFSDFASSANYDNKLLMHNLLILGLMASMLESHIDTLNWAISRLWGTHTPRKSLDQTIVEGNSEFVKMYVKQAVEENFSPSVRKAFDVMLTTKPVPDRASKPSALTMWIDALDKLDFDSVATNSVGFNFPLGDWEAEFERDMYKYSDFHRIYEGLSHITPRIENIVRTVEEIDKKLAARRAGE